MVNSQVLTRQRRGPAAGFGRSQTLLGEDSAAGDGKFQNLSKSCLMCVLCLSLGGTLVSKAPRSQAPRSQALSLRSGSPCRAQVRPGLPDKTQCAATTVNTALLRELPGAHVPAPIPPPLSKSAQPGGCSQLQSLESSQAPKARKPNKQGGKRGTERQLHLSGSHHLLLSGFPKLPFCLCLILSGP